ncbi:MAG: signal peptide peptidase SppA, partial [Oscillospiraceae bacterium]
IININGTIQASPDTAFTQVSYDHNKIMAYIDELIKDDNNFGILLKVNSGGGTVYHSDEMYSKLMEYKEKTGRPVHAYFKEVAASGAYYISCAADYISANKNCWTGSIGVIISYTNLKGLYDKLGMEEIIISSGTNKGMGSAAQVLTKEQRDIYQGLVDESYDNFVNIVAQGRKIDKEKVIQLADGRVYTASQALENKLIDKVETWQEALDGMTELTGVECYEKNLMSNGSYLSYLIGEYKSATPKSDMQAVEEMLSKDLNGVPLYYYQR